MKSLRHTTQQLLIVFAFYGSAFCSPDSGFFLPDSVNEMTLRYKSIKNLIVLQVMINDSIPVNLILDTGCRNLVLFGKRFEKLFNASLNRKVQFSGLGSGKPVQGYLSLSNKVSIYQVLGESIPIVVVPNRNVMAMYTNVHGVIGYEIFFRFEIELNPQAETITFRPAMRASAPVGFYRVPLRIVDCRPVINSEVRMDSDNDRKYDMMIDTGSTLGLLVKTTNMDEFNYNSSKKVIGLGFNGPIYGYETQVGYMNLEGLVMTDLATGVIESPWHNYASIGMKVLKDYIVVINYFKFYACFKKLSSV
jgi:predicted aspartyl protease